MLGELPSPDTLSEVWSAAHARWWQHYAKQANLLPTRLAGLDQWIGRTARG